MGSPLEQLTNNSQKDETYKVFSGVSRNTAPSIEPVTSAEMQLWLKMDDITTDDTLIDNLITSARVYIEENIKRSLITQKWNLILNSFPNAGYIELPYGVVQSIDSIKSYDEDNTLNTFASASYSMSSERSIVFLNEGYTWPTALRLHDAVEIIYTTGYGDAATDVPEVLKTAIMQLAAHWYENRQSVSSDGLKTVPLSVGIVMEQFKKRRL